MLIVVLSVPYSMPRAAMVESLDEARLVIERLTGVPCPAGEQPGATGSDGAVIATIEVQTREQFEAAVAAEEHLLARRTRPGQG